MKANEEILSYYEKYESGAYIKRLKCESITTFLCVFERESEVILLIFSVFNFKFYGHQHRIPIFNRLTLQIDWTRP